MTDIIYNQVVNFIASKPVNYITTVGNVISDLNLATSDKLYDDQVSQALSYIRRYKIKCGSKHLRLIDKAPKYSRGGRRPTNLYRVESI